MFRAPRNSVTKMAAMPNRDSMAWPNANPIWRGRVCYLPAQSAGPTPLPRIYLAVAFRAFQRARK